MVAVAGKPSAAWDDGALDRILGAACELAGADHGVLSVFGPDGIGIVHRSVLGEAAPAWRSVDVPIHGRDGIVGILSLSSGTGFSSDDERSVKTSALAAGVVIDNARWHADTERRRRWYEVTAEITQLMLGPFEPQQALQLIARRAREVSGSRIGVVMLSAEDELIIEAVDGPDEFQAYVGRPVILPMLYDVMRGDRQVLIEDIVDVARKSGRIDEIPEVRSLGRTVLAPLPAGTHVTGGLLLVSAERGAVLEVSEGPDLVKMFASQATLALDRAQAQRDQSMIAVLSDRDRIARDLHDLVIQRLFATGLQLQGMQSMVLPEGQERITRAVEDIDATIRDLRAAIFELHHQPRRRSLRADVQTLVEEYAGPLGFRPVLKCSGPLDLAVPAAARPQILAAIRESLSNVVRHAQASAVTVEVTVAEGEVVTRVSDDGVGFTLGEQQSGLRNLRERAESLGGAVRLERRQPHGTTLELRAPLT